MFEILFSEPEYTDKYRIFLNFKLKKGYVPAKVKKYYCYHPHVYYVSASPSHLSTQYRLDSPLKGKSVSNFSISKAEILISS